MMTGKRIWTILCVLAISITGSKASQNASVTYDQKTKTFIIHDFIADDSIAYGTFTDEIFKTGWSYLEIKSNEKFPDPYQAYAAGVVEGYLTKDLLKKHFYNLVSDYCDGEESYCQRLKGFLQENMNFINSNVFRRDYDVYWHQVALTLEQLKGLEDGYKNVTSQPSTDVDLMGFLLLNIMGDLEDLEVVLKKSDMRRVLGSGHCSALVKVLPGNKDIYFSQVTWSTYTSMLRILKKYSLKVHAAMDKGSPVVPGHTSTFSSQPGVLYSGDDFYLISSGLGAMETTFGNGNATLWQYVVPETILEWQRNIISNRLAKDGRQWVTLFSILNSGTYNNQWMVVDYNKFTPGKPLQDGFLYVLEQLPGYLHSGDMTDVLRQQGYWPSYNVAYFKDIFVMSGSQANADKYGDWFTYERNPRALIFKRDQVKVKDVDSMIKLMRYNDYTHDPLSRCNCTPPYSAENAISARCDLNPENGTYQFAALGHRQHGATDMKLTTFELSKSLEFIAIGGPTYDPLPPFQWSKSDFDKKVKHVGHPDLWQFKPVIHKWL